MPPVPRKPYRKEWTTYDKQLINAIKPFPSLYNGTENKESETVTWKKAFKTFPYGVSSYIKKWDKIRFNYAKLKHMIHAGRVTEDNVRKHPKTMCYLDGTLDFLEPYIHLTPDLDLPSEVHTEFEKLFGESKIEKIFKVNVENNHIEVIEDFQQDIRKEPSSILPIYDVDYDNDSGTASAQLAFVETGSQLLKDEIDLDIIAENNLNDEDPAAGNIFSEIEINQGDDTTVQEMVNKVPEIVHVELPHTSVTDNMISEENKSVKDLTKKKPPTTVAHFLVNYQYTLNNRNDSDSESDVSEYMNDLAEMLCLRLKPERRKEFLAQIDLIVSEILEGI